MSLTAHVSKTRNGQSCAELREGDRVVLKAYPNADGSKLRIVLAELRGYGQVLISPDNRCLEFTRKA